MEVRLGQDTVWLTQAQTAKMKKAMCKKMHFAGSSKPVSLHSLDANISVGYRVNSKRGTQFRIWATRILREHLVKGYTANEHRQWPDENPHPAGAIAPNRAIYAERSSSAMKP